MAFVAVANDKFSKGVDGSGREVTDAYRVLEVRRALEQVYATDAHLVAYHVPGRELQPRINKPGLASSKLAPVVDVFFCDVDNDGHAPWTPDLLATAREQEASLPILQTAGVYYTSHGRRFVQPLATPIPVTEVEPYLQRWLLDLELAGLAVDWSCRDWTRHFRLPHVRRAGSDYRSPVVELARMMPIELDPFAEDECSAMGGSTKASEGNAGVTRFAAPLVIDWTPELPNVWHDKVRTLAEAVRNVQGEWHGLFLALAGALVARNVPLGHLPAMCRAISLATRADTRTADREAVGRTTAERKAAGLPIAGTGHLRRQYPAVAVAFERCFGTRLEQRMSALARPTEDLPPALSPDDAKERLVTILREAPSGPTAVRSNPGAGKTQAAIAVAIERALTPYKADDAKGLRAPPQSKTAICVDKNALAEQVVASIEAQGGTVRRIFGPLSVLNAEGKPECRFHDVALPLVHGKQSVQWEFCQGRGKERCRYYDECLARDGVEGPADARITVGTHPLLDGIDAAAGTTGLLVVDEPPSLLATETFNSTELDKTIVRLPSFASRYYLALYPALQALRLAFQHYRDSTAAMTLEQVITAMAPNVDEALMELARVQTGIARDDDRATMILAAARAAVEKDARSDVPPLRPEQVAIAKSSRAFAEELGSASRVLHLVHQSLTREDPVVVRFEKRGRGTVLALTSTHEAMARVLKREGALVLLDANIDVQLPFLERVLNGKPRYLEVEVRDGAPIQRTLLRVSHANRRHWLSREFEVMPSLASCLREAAAWAREGGNTKRIAVLTMYRLEVAFGLALDATNRARRKEWVKLGEKESGIASFAKQLGPLLQAFPGELLFGHYGALRGLDHFADVDAIITLGDPWPNLGDVRTEKAYLGVTGEWEERVQALARAELEQAHGRLRTVHRKRPGRALHVGAVLPGGRGWSDGSVEVRTLPSGVARRTLAVEEGLTADDCTRLRAMGQRALAARIGVAPKTLRTYLGGTYAPTKDVAALLRSLARPANDNRDPALLSALDYQRLRAFEPRRVAEAIDLGRLAAAPYISGARKPTPEIAAKLRALIAPVEAANDNAAPSSKAVGE